MEFLRRKGAVAHDGRIRAIVRFPYGASLERYDNHARRPFVLRYFVWYAKCCRFLGCLYISNLNDDTLKAARATWRSPYTIYSVALLTTVSVFEGSNFILKNACKDDAKCKFTDTLGVVAYAVALLRVFANVACLVRGSAKILQLLRDAVAFERSSAFRPVAKRSGIKDIPWVKVILRLSVLVSVVATLSLAAAVHYRAFHTTRGHWHPVLKASVVCTSVVVVFYGSTLYVPTICFCEVLVQYVKAQVVAFGECQATWATRSVLRDAASRIEAVRVNVCKIRALKNAVNDVWGPAIVTSSACLVTTLCTTLYRSFYARVGHAEAWLRFTYTMYTALCFVDMVLVSSDLGSEVEKLKDATKPMSLLDATDTYSLQVGYLHDIIEPDSMCLSAGRFFRLDRTLLVTMAGSIITFTVILVQTSDDIMHGI